MAVLNIGSLFLHATLQTNVLQIVERIDIGKHEQLVLRPARRICKLIRTLFQHIAEEVNLAPEIVTQRPAHKGLDILLPLTAVGHIEHTSLQIGYHQRTMR